ncbi:MAG: N-acetylneuraminate synthase family protein [Rhodospirillales bacterium]|nr:N-acetylneuraminate synthase family protein [Rhodospirillales bacterium]
MNNLQQKITIDGRVIGPGQPCFIIAEIGVNHNGDVDIAHKMIDAIADAGADCVKFQTFSASEFVNNEDEIYEYLSQGKMVRESQLAMFSRLELKYEAFAELFEHAHRRGLIALSTPTDKKAADLLETLGVGGYKIGSDDLVYTPFLEYVAAKNKPLIISTGMADAVDIERAIAAIGKAGNSQVCVLHCVSLYPTPDNDVNLLKIPAMQERFACPVGFSDHSDGVTAAIGAVAIGACAVEKHFTLDKNMPGPDHRFSADPAELADLVAGIRRVEAVLGAPDIKPAASEMEMRNIARRSIVAARDLSVGHVISSDDLAYQRPGTGLMPYEAESLIGKTTRVALMARALIKLGDIEGAE